MFRQRQAVLWSCAHYTAHDENGLGGSDSLQYIWAACRPNVGGRSRPNRGFVVAVILQASPFAFRSGAWACVRRWGESCSLKMG